MRSQVFRVGAAVVVVLAVTGVALWFYGGGATPALADFLNPILEAKAVKYKMTTEVKGPHPMTVTSEVTMLDGARHRQEVVMPDKSKMVMIDDRSQGKKLTLFPASKKATVLTLANMPEYQTPEDNDPLAGFRLILLHARDKPGIKREPLGEKEIDGRRVIGFRVGTDRGDFELWGDPKTGLPVRIEITMGMGGHMKATMSDFVFNVDVDESLFSVEPPAGYTVENQTTDATPREEEDLIEMFRRYTTMTDGAFPESLDTQAVSWTFSKRYNTRMMWDSYTSPALVGDVSEEQRRQFEEQRRQFEEQVGEVMDKMHDEALQGKTSEEQTRKLADELNRTAMRNIAPMLIQGLWEGLAPANLKANEKQRREFEKRMRELMEEQPNELGALMGKETTKIVLQALWEDVAPAKWKTNEQRRQQFEELTLKWAEAKSDEKQEIEEEFRAILGDEMFKAVEDWETEVKKTQEAREARRREYEEAQEAKSRKSMEDQGRVQRGVMFANQLPPGADAHYVGKGVSLGAPDTPIFWYRPEGSKKYRVIYADLSVREADTPPNVPKES